MTGLHLGRNVMACSKDTTPRPPTTPPPPPPTTGSLTASTVVTTVNTAVSCETVLFTLNGGNDRMVGGTFGMTSPGLIDCNYRTTWSGLAPATYNACVLSEGVNRCKMVSVSAGQAAGVMF